MKGFLNIPGSSSNISGLLNSAVPQNQKIMGLLENPLFLASMGLLSAGRDSRVDPFQSALGGIAQAQQFRNASADRARVQAEEERKQAEAERKAWEHQQKVELSERIAALRNPMAMAHGALQGPPQAGEGPLMREGADPTLALLSQVDPVAAAKLSANMRIKGGPTSAIQNAYAIAQMNGRTEPTKEDYLLANAPAAYSPDTIKLYDENFIYDPLTRKLTPPGGGSAEEYIEKAIKIQKDRKKEEAYAARTGTSEAEADANATAAGRRYASFTEKNGRILASVERAKDLISRFSAGFGSMLSGMPETDARALAAELTSIKSNLGFAEIQEMRLNSPTGGALGNVSTFELDGLQSTIDKLDQGLRGSELKEALQTVENHLTNLQELQRLDLQLAAGRLTPEQVEERIAPYLNHIEQGSPTDNLKQSKKSSAYWKKRARVMGARNE